MTMKIGFCAQIDRIQEAASAGYDYLEPAVNAVAQWTEDEYRKKLNQVLLSPIPTPSFNCLFPGDLPLLGREANLEKISNYLKKALARAARMGAKTVVFGSGRSRLRPEYMAYADAFRDLTRVARLIGDEAAPFGIDIVVEPLNRKETNMINSLAEGACLAATANHPQVKLLGDYYHIAAEHEPLEEIVRLGGIAHAHIATEAERLAPTEAEEGFLALFSAMKCTGYEGIISVEGKCENLLQDGPKTVRLLKALWEQA